MTKLSDKVRDLLAYACEEDPYAENKLRAILAGIETLEIELEETKQVAIASRWCSGFYSQAPGPGQIAQMFGGLLMGLSEYRRTDVRNAKIEAYEDALDMIRGGGMPAFTGIALQACIDALKAGDK